MKKKQALPKTLLYVLGSLIVFGVLVALSVAFKKTEQTTLQNDVASLESLSLEEKKQLTDEQWKTYLPSESYQVLRHKGTEFPFTGDLLDNKQAGTYVTADCGIPVFRSEHKYDSKTGWPSFWQPMTETSVELVLDTSEGIERTEVIEPTCNSHLGHLFDDGPDPTGKRFCINSAALRFVPD